MHNRRIASLFAPLLLAFSLNCAAQAADEWITVNKDYSSQRYVDLDQINPSNVRALKEVCEAQLNEPSWYNSGLLMVGRVEVEDRDVNNREGPLEITLLAG